MSDYAIKKLEHDQFEILIPLMKDCFGSDVEMDYFKWKFLNNPAGFVEGFVAVAPDGEIAAYYGVIPELYYIDDNITTIYQSCDTMTHSRHRRKGLFEKLAKHCYAHLREQGKLFVIGFAGGKSAPGFQKFGWETVFQTRHYFFPKVFSLLRLPSSSRDILEIDDLSAIEASVLESNNQKPLRSYKSIENFRWRLSNPLNKYITIGYCPGGEKIGCKSWLTYYLKPDQIIIFDFSFENKKAGKKLLGYLKNLLRNTGRRGIVAFCQENGLYARQLLSNGFISNPFNKGPLSFKTPFIIYADEERMKRFADADKWLISSYDHDAM